MKFAFSLAGASVLLALSCTGRYQDGNCGVCSPDASGDAGDDGGQPCGSVACDAGGQCIWECDGGSTGCGSGEYCPSDCFSCPCVGNCLPDPPPPPNQTPCGSTSCAQNEICVVPCCGGIPGPDGGADCTPSPPYCAPYPTVCGPALSCECLENTGAALTLCDEEACGEVDGGTLLCVCE
jgi:hypothetical protein